MTSVLERPTLPAPVAAAPRPPSSGHTIAAAPTGERAQRVRDLLEFTASCTDEVELQRCREQIVTEYLPVARSLAARYAGRGVERGDLEQLACLGLVKAVQRWQPGRSDDFLQFAVPTIVGEIKRYFRDHSWLVRPPRRIQELRAAISEAEQLYRHRDGSAPTDAELASVTGAKAEDIGEARAASACCRPRSLRRPCSGNYSAIAPSPLGASMAAKFRKGDEITMLRIVALVRDEEYGQQRVQSGLKGSTTRSRCPTNMSSALPLRTKSRRRPNCSTFRIS